VLLHRVHITLSAPLGTPLTSGTLFGHLCWAVRERDGGAGLRRWLEGQVTAPWLVSDGFPAGHLPRPLLQPGRRRPPQDVRAADAAKRQTRLPWIAVADFMKLRDRLSEDVLISKLKCAPWQGEFEEWRLAHNLIDRRRGTTPDEGGLYFVDEDWSYVHPAGKDRDIYVRTSAGAEEIGDLFRRVGEKGYGRDATWGRGRFSVLEVVREDRLDAARGPRCLSLSHGVRSRNMLEPRYKLAPHYGKVGAELAHSGASPFKYPILLTRPGATFRPADDGPYGELLAGIHPTRSEIRHCARHLVLAYAEPDT
jgi:CRISPR-associated protein Csm4